MVIAGKEYTMEELKKGIRNPYFHMLCKQVELDMPCGIYEIYAEIGRSNGVPAETIMNSILKSHTETLLGNIGIVKMNRFEWDEAKNIINKAKHFVAFEDVLKVFDDEYAITIPDEAHSRDEERFIIIGTIPNDPFKVIHVCHCYRDNDVIRIISARNATKNEKKLYYGGRL